VPVSLICCSFCGFNLMTLCTSILTIEKLDSIFHQTTVPLKHTPRKLTIHPHHKLIVTVQSDHGQTCESDKRKIKESLKNGDEQLDLVEHFENLPVDTFGHPRADNTKWRSCIQLIHPVQVSISRTSTPPLVLIFRHYPG
jgi:splicing factor 3B subunit 3